MSEGEKNRATVEIYGKTYTIVGPSSPEWIRDVAQLVDDKMREISQRHPHLDVVKIAVLSAVNLADENLRLKQELDELVKLIES